MKDLQVLFSGEKEGLVRWGNKFISRKKEDTILYRGENSEIRKEKNSTSLFSRPGGKPFNGENWIASQGKSLGKGNRIHPGPETRSINNIHIKKSFSGGGH